MNIGIVTTWFERGAAVVSRAYMNTLSQKHDVYIYARGGEEYGLGDPDWDRENVTWGKKVPIGISTFIDWLDFKKWVTKHKLDLIIFNEQHSWHIILKSLALNIVIGAYVDYYTAETVPFFWLYDFLLCNTKRHYSVFQTHPQAIYVPWGTDCSLYKPSTSGPEPGVVRFFHSAGMGGVGLRKGTDILVRAFQMVSGNVRLIIHSQVGIERFADVAELVRNDRRITLVDATLKAPGLYHLGDIYVYPTRLEGIGLTIAEALASGLPVITTDNAPMNEFVQDGVTGRLVPVENYREREDKYYWPESICSESALANAMQFYVDNPQELINQSCQGRAYAIQYLDWGKNSAGLSNFLMSVNKIKPKSQALKSATARYERKALSNWYIAQAFTLRCSGQSSEVRHHLVRGLFHDPKWILDRGIWSIGLEAFMGKRAENVRRMVKRFAR